MLTTKLLRNATGIALAVLSSPLWGQSAQPSVTLPLAGVHYRYWPEQLVQWIGPELPYSMIVLDVDDRGKQPVYDAELIDKSGKVVHYTNTAEEAAIDESAGFTVHRVAMQFDGPGDPANGAQYMLRFNLETGVPVVWQFVLGSDVTEQGSGLSPVPTPVPILMYRETGGLAGQGTALQVGNVTSTADVWTELAHPPYFVPYRGALSSGVHILTFVPGAAAWKGDGQSLTDAMGKTVTVAKEADGVAITDKALGTTASYTMDGTSGISRVSFAPGSGKRDHSVSLVFSPMLAPGAQSSFDVIAGKKTKIAGGTVQTASEAGTGVSEAWTFTAPDSLHGKEATATANLQQ